MPSADMTRLAERHRANRRARRVLLKAKDTELLVERYRIFDYLDRLPLEQLRAIAAAAKQKFGTPPRKPGRPSNK